MATAGRSSGLKTASAEISTTPAKFVGLQVRGAGDAYVVKVWDSEDSTTTSDDVISILGGATLVTTVDNPAVPIACKNGIYLELVSGTTPDMVVKYIAGRS